MNILYVLHSLEIGGAEKITVETAIGMKERGHRVVAAAPHGHYEDTLLKNGIKIYFLDFRPEKKSLMLFLKSFMEVMKILKENNVEIIHTIHRWPNLICYCVAYFTKTKLVWTDHNVLVGKKMLTVYKDAVISISNTNREYLIKYFNIPGSKIRVIYNGVRPSKSIGHNEIESFRSRLGFKRGDIVFCNIGRLTEQKGQVYLVKALEQIVKVKHNVHCLIVGDGPLMMDLKKTVLEKKLEKNIHFLGEREDVPLIIASCVFMVLPSLWEGFPLTILEAFCLGKPVIASDVGGIREMVEEGKNGFLVPQANSEALSGAILLAISNLEHLDKLGEYAKETVNIRFAFSKMLLNIEKVYEEVLNARAN